MDEKISEIVGNQPPEKVKEMNLDDCVAPAKFEFLEPFTNLEFLSMRNCTLNSLRGFPKFPNLKKLDLSGNKMSSTLYFLGACPQLTHLNISSNNFKNTLCLKPLKKLKHLQSLIFVSNEANKVPEYRRKVFFYLKNLKDLDGEDKTADDGEKPTAFDETVGDSFNGNTATKRKSNAATSPQKKLKLAMPQKNALMQLNELKPGLKYIVESMSGPAHNPQFVVSVEVSGNKYIGNGNSKQSAKHDAAQLALSSFVQFQNTPAVMMALGKPNESMDFTMDSKEEQFDSHKNGSNAGIKTEIPVGLDKRAIMKILSEADKKNPVMLLNEIHTGLEYSVIEQNSPSPTQRFLATVSVEGEMFEGTGQNKKLAKTSAARAVLSHLYNVSYSTSYVSPPSSDAPFFAFPQPVADKISKMLMNTFNDVMIGNAEHAKWKIIAGVAMSRDDDMEDLQIIGLGTGTKCINGEHISMVGANLNDCHAEIISRRCLKDFLYTNLELYLEGEGDQSILMKREGGGFCVKPNIKFHLYINTAPCGDARIFCPHEELDLQGVGDRHPNRNSRGILRTKIESGEGTIPIKPGQNIQTWDGILPGQERLLTMSCSDKIASWNVLGLQGALLSHFLEPIYLESVVLGSLFHPTHLQRALFGRIENSLPDLQPPFRLNRPKMCALTSPETRHLSKSPNFSVNWTTGLGRAEVVNATTGKVENGVVSRLAKRSFFQRFINIYDRLPRVAEVKCDSKLGLYSSYKSQVPHYQQAKRLLFKAFADNGFGSWVKKPMEQNEFELTF